MTDPDLNLKPRLERLGDRVQPRTDAFDRLDRVRARRARGRRLGTIALAFVVAVAGTWGAFAVFRSTGAQPADDPTPVVDSPCAPQTTTLAVVVSSDLVIDTDCWNVPADTPLTIDVDYRQAGVSASITIEPLPCPSDVAVPPSPDTMVCEPSRPKPFTSGLVDGGRAAFDVPALGPGIYMLYDEMHPRTTQAYLFVGSGPFPDPAVLATPSPTVVAPESCDGISAPHAQITFQNLGWDLTCWNAPAGKALAIRYLNRDDGVRSGLAIAAVDSCYARMVMDIPVRDCVGEPRPAYEGALVTGPSGATYDVGELPPGTYVMYDPAHTSTANATLIVD
jgi:hypothetical protein